MRTVEDLTFELVPPDTARVLVAVLETTIGVLLLTGSLPRLTLVLLGVSMVGFLSPLVLMTGRLFAGPSGAPTLEGQYVLKDLILAAAILVLAGDVLRKRSKPIARQAR